MPLFAHVAGHHAVFLLEALGEIAGGGEADGVGHFANALVGGEQQLVGTAQTGCPQ